MRCHYEVLGVTETANNDELKKAYRKLALQWHPDKNLDQIAEAKKRFLEIQAAYEVLTDPRERAWYDAHRDVMINKGFGHDDTVNIYPFFTSSCYQGYNDSENGFYTIYNKLFKDIAEQDLIGANDRSLSIPEFGTSESNYEEIVGPFYAYWSNYCTLRTYVWVEEHDTRDAIDRRVRRLMEQENKKLIDKAKKERNDEVRELVAFVKKRDKRVQLRKIFLEEQAAQKKKADNERRNREKQKKLEELAQYKESQWMSFDQFEKQLEDMEKSVKDNFQEKKQNSSDESDGENAIDESGPDNRGELYCVACNKSFKSDKAFLNHENSRKHKEFVFLMKTHIREENDELLRMRTNDEQVPDVTNEDHDHVVQLPCNTQASKSKKKKKKQRRNNKEAASSEDETEEVQSNNSTSKKQQGQNNKDADSSDDDIEQLRSELLSKEQEEVHIILPTSKTKRKDETNTETANGHDEASAPVLLHCLVCKEQFTSRNVLFKHITERGHAKPVNVKIEPKPKTKTKKKS